MDPDTDQDVPNIIPPKLEQLLEKSNREVAAGQLWRAKEIIRSSFHRFGFQAPLNAAYGKILLAMHDDMQAGKYLFYGEPLPSDQEQQAIDLFTNRHGKDGKYGLWVNRPLALEGKILDLPDFIKKRLAQFHDMDNPKVIEITAEKDENNWGCMMIMLFMMTCLVVGFITAIKWVVGLFT